MAATGPQAAPFEGGYFSRGRMCPEGQEGLSDSASLSGLRDTGEAGRKEDVLRADNAIGLKSPRAFEKTLIQVSVKGMRKDSQQPPS